jgi:hypothetical protein
VIIVDPNTPSEPKSEIDRLRAENARLRELLEYYDLDINIDIDGDGPKGPPVPPDPRLKELIAVTRTVFRPSAGAVFGANPFLKLLEKNRP